MGAEQQLNARLDAHRPDVALSPEQLCEVRQVIAQVIPGAQVWVFGSRVIGRARPFSDLDLMLTQPAKLDWAQRAALTDAFEASRLPFRVDVVESAGLTSTVAERIGCERVDLSVL